MKLCRELGVLYIDTVIEPWLGFYYDDKVSNAARTNYALRETMLAEKARSPGGTTAIHCSGANPGMVSWFVKQALLDIAKDTKLKFTEPKYNDRDGWAKLMKKLGVKGIHVAERDTQRAKDPKPLKTFWNTWSVEGLLSESLQPAELGWGTHEKWMPKNAKRHKQGTRAVNLSEPARRQHPRAHLVPDARPAIRASRSPTMRRSRSRTITRCAARTARRSTARPAITPTIRAMSRSCRWTSCSARAAKSRSACMCWKSTKSSTAATSWAC